MNDDVKLDETEREDPIPSAGGADVGGRAGDDGDANDPAIDVQED